MKNIVCWRNKYFIFGMIFFLMLIISSCSSNESNYSFNGEDTHRTEQTGIINALTGLFGNTEQETPANGKYVYVNNEHSPNYVSAFSINGDGTLVQLAGSPYATGGNGNPLYFGSNPIALAPVKRLIFASNLSDSTISVFSINMNDGTLTLIGAPVYSGQFMNPSGSLVVDNNENYLFVGNSNSISVFAISASGAITPVAGSPFNMGSNVNGTDLSLSGNILYVANMGSGKIIVLNVAADGSLSHIAGSPFAYTAGGSIASFAISSSTIGIAAATSGVLSSYSIDAAGAPTWINTLNTGGNNQAVTTARDGSLAILAGGETNQISVVNVGSDGTLTQVPGSPFTTSSSSSGYAVANPEGTFLYNTEHSNIEGFSIGANGALTSIGIFPITNAGSRPRGIVVF